MAGQFNHWLVVYLNSVRLILCGDLLDLRQESHCVSPLVSLAIILPVLLFLVNVNIKCFFLTLFNF